MVGAGRVFFSSDIGSVFVEHRHFGIGGLMASDPVEQPAIATCNLCGAKVPAGDVEMLGHMILMHPLEALHSQAVQKRIGNFFYDLGVYLGGKVRGGKK